MEVQVALLNEVWRKAKGEQRWKIVITGQVNAGKSTLINSILGGDYLHVSSIPATCGLCFIQHSEGIPKLSSLQHNNSIPIAESTNIPEMVKQANNYLREGNAGQEKLLLQVPIPLSCDKDFLNKFQIVDTPGPNEAANPTVKRIATDILQSADFLIVVVNYSMMGTTGEYEMWATLRDLRGDILSDQRLLLVVNKFDQKGYHGLDSAKTIEYVQKKVRDVTGFLPSPSSIILTSSKFAITSRLMMSKAVLPNDSLVERLYTEFFPSGERDDRSEQFTELSLINWESMLVKSNIRQVEEWMCRTINDSTIRSSVILHDLVRLSKPWDTMWSEETQKYDDQCKIHADDYVKLLDITEKFEFFIEQIPCSITALYTPISLDSIVDSFTPHFSHNGFSEALSEAQQLLENCQINAQLQLASHVSSATVLINKFFGALANDLISFSKEFRDLGIDYSPVVVNDWYSPLLNAWQNAEFLLSVEPASVLLTTSRTEDYITTETRHHSKTTRVQAGWDRTKIFGKQIDKKPIWKDITETWSVQEAVTKQRQVPVYTVDSNKMKQQVNASIDSWNETFNNTVQDTSASVCNAVTQGLHGQFLSHKSQIQLRAEELMSNTDNLYSIYQRSSAIYVEGNKLIDKIHELVLARKL